MFEIKPLSPSYPVIKPAKIKKDDNSQKKQLPEKKPHSDDKDSEPVTHIDESV
jgi:hypothetical protein